MKQFGPIKIIEAPNNCKVPFSRSLFIDGTEKILIDTGADPNTLLEIGRQGIDLIINTHYHPDHTKYNYLFENTEKWINPIEFQTSLTIEGIAKHNGVYQEWGEEGVKRWRKRIPDDLIKSLKGIRGKYEYGVEYKFGGTKVVFLHTPGHTGGLSCPYFPELGVVCAGDYDMTSFGPWYNGTDGNIEEFILSAKKLLELDADTYITAHQKGIFSKNEFKKAMEQYLAIIDKRDEKIAHYVRQGMSFEEISEMGIFYPKRLLNDFMLKTWERSGIRKHLQRLGLSAEPSRKALKAN